MIRVLDNTQEEEIEQGEEEESKGNTFMVMLSILLSMSR